MSDIGLGFTKAKLWSWLVRKARVLVSISLLPLSLFSLSLLPLSLTAAQVPLPEMAPYMVEAEFRLTHPVLSLNLSGDATKELVVLGIDDNHQRHLAVYGLEQQGGLDAQGGLDTQDRRYRQLFSHPLPIGFLAFDFSEYQETAPERLQSLYFLSGSELFKLLLSPEGIAFSSLSPVSPLVQSARGDFLTRGSFVRDLNKDGLDDFIIGGIDKTQVLIQQSQGLRAQTLPIRADVLQYQDGARYIEASRFFADLNLDGREDIIKVGQGELESYPQLADGKFASSATFVSMSQAINGLDWWHQRDAYGEALDQSNLIYRKVEQLKDTNQDGLVDMVVRYTKSRGVLDRVNDYEIYLGQRSEKGVQFAKSAHNVIHAEGTLTGFSLVDIDQDKVDEVLVSGFDIGLSQIIGALISGSIDQDVFLFKMNGEGKFPNEPNVEQSVELNFSLTSGQSGAPVILLADMNGDDLKDLLLSDGNEALRIYLGQHDSDQRGERLFSRSSESFKLTLPSDGTLVQSDDLNHDGKSDLLISYGRQDKLGLQQAFVVFMAR
ncbi:VCBS repeat-containing protein [Shewanella sp. AS1]|uniref:VCBS repeat-containing protein n=1 Tax=Shewanella sp. AS1 TaxID=2907626 RepID=UPI001F3A8601|nr:VCBS repeat-containing protein [Shewanella sp. AS1]MCE9679954.1 VCBS repeat-containing protein [Shewanella sp. AS1]